MKLTVILILLLVPASFAQSFKDKIATFEDGKKYSVEYDKFKNQTTVRTPSRWVKRTPIYFQIVSQSPGETLDKAKLWITAYAVGVDWRYLKNHRMILLADKEKVDLGQGTHEGTVQGRGVTEFMSFKIDAEQLKLLAKSQTIEFQLGDTTGVFNEKIMLDLKNLVSLL